MHFMKFNFIQLSPLFSVAMLTGCAVEPVARPSGSNDPANADAPAAVSPAYRPRLLATNKTFLSSEAGKGAGEMNMSGMEHMDHTSNVSKPESSAQQEAKKSYYTCVMHPQIHRDKPGRCPICGMTLVKKGAVSSEEKK